MEFSDEISPIFDSKIKITKEIAYPVMKAVLNSVIYSILSFQDRKKRASLRIWKHVTLSVPAFEQSAIKNHAYVFFLKARNASSLLKMIMKKRLHKEFCQIVWVSSQTPMKQSLNDRNPESERSQRIRNLEAIKEASMKKLSMLKEQLKAIQVNNEILKTSIDSAHARNKNNAELAERISDENARLSDKLVSYEMYFNHFTSAMDAILPRKNTLRNNMIYSELNRQYS